MWHHLHIFTHFQIFTLSYFQVYHTSRIFTFQGYYTVIDFMCSTFHCDNVFCSSAPSKSQKGNETVPLISFLWTRPLTIHEFIDRRLINPICFFNRTLIMNFDVRSSNLEFICPLFCSPIHEWTET